MTASVSCVIPAYNESARIGAVLAAVVGHPALAEVIVVDDGSQDDTARVAAAVAGVTVIRQPVNRGKTAAVAAGVQAAGAPLLMLLDSDLLGLRPAHLTALIAPVATGRADAAISLRGNAPGLWRAIGLDYISGERVMPRAHLADRLEALQRLPRFGLEVHMNARWIAEGTRLAVVPWPEVKSPLKAAKHGAWAGLRADLGMMADIFRTVPPATTLRQIAAMRALRVS